MNKLFQPMLASTELVTEDILHTLQFPLLGTPKKDGIRGQVFLKHGKHRMMSRKHLPIPNCFIEEWCEENEIPIGCDGELVVQGRFGDEDFHTCQSRFMSQYSPEYKWTYYVFDAWWNDPESDPGYHHRFKNVRRWIRAGGFPNIELLTPVTLNSPAEVIAYEKQMVDMEGNEGIILRDPNGRYKQGRCTLKEGLMMKMKRFEDFEAEIIDFQERKHNANPQTRDKVGAAKRSKHKANMHKTGLLGAFIVRLPDGTETKVSGFTEDFARKVWLNKMDFYGKTLTAKKMAHGQKDKPRSAIFKGIRHD